MKTKTHNMTLADLKLLMFLLVFTTTLAVVSSCGNNKISDQLPEPPTPSPLPPFMTEEKVFSEVDELPKFKDGEKGIVDFIAKNTVYPEDAILDYKTGKVIVRFVVEKNGSVSNVEIEKSVNTSLDAEAKRVVASLPKFEKPGMLEGKPVRVEYMIPINFALKPPDNLKK